MNFKDARKTFELLKRAYVTGAISYDELCLKVDTDLEVTDKNGTLWKIDEDTGRWLCFDTKLCEWHEKQPEDLSGKPAADGLPIAFEPPKIAAVPADIYDAWKKHHTNPELCHKCGKTLKPENKFCTGCGEKRQSS